MDAEPAKSAQPAKLGDDALGQIAASLADLYTALYEARPVDIRTSLTGNMLAFVFAEGLSVADEWLLRAGRTEQLAEFRRQFFEVVEGEFVGVVGDLTGLPVTYSLYGFDPLTRTSHAIFVLDLSVLRGSENRQAVLRLERAGEPQRPPPAGRGQRPSGDARRPPEAGARATRRAAPRSLSRRLAHSTPRFPPPARGYRFRPDRFRLHRQRRHHMIMRLDRLQAEIPPPTDPDPNGASIVQELLGGKFGEMSTFMNYTYQSFNFRNRQGARPFYDLVASIAAEEFGHIELVATAINTMLTGAGEGKPGKRNSLKGLSDARNAQEFLAGGASAMVQDSMGKPWNGDYVNATGDLIGDLTHNFFLETGARNNKLKVYESVDHPAARALTGYLLVRGGVHQVAYARALENLTGAKMEKLFPTPRIPTDKIPECKPHIKRGEHLKLYRWSPDDFKELAAVFNGPHPETGEELEVAEEIHPEGAPAFDLPPQEALFAPGPDAGEIEAIAQKLRQAAGLPKEPTGVVAQAKGKAKKRR